MTDEYLSKAAIADMLGVKPSSTARFSWPRPDIVLRKGKVNQMVGFTNETVQEWMKTRNGAGGATRGRTREQIVDEALERHRKVEDFRHARQYLTRGEIAELLQVSKPSVVAWKLPQPDVMIAGTTGPGVEGWSKERILRWNDLYRDGAIGPQPKAHKKKPVK